jgi:hypothetical protein
MLTEESIKIDLAKYIVGFWADGWGFPVENWSNWISRTSSRIAGETSSLLEGK